MASKQGEFVGAIDCGTTSARFLVFDEFANVVAEHQREFPQYYEHPGWHSHDPKEIQEVCESCVAEATKKLASQGYAADSIKAIGITNQRETTVAWSRKTGKQLCRAIVWDDGRTKAEVTHYEKKLAEEGIEVKPGEFQKGPEAIRNITGIPISTYFSAIKLRWMMQHHHEVRDAHETDDLLFGTVDSWLVYNLTGGANGGVIGNFMLMPSLISLFQAFTSSMYVLDPIVMVPKMTTLTTANIGKPLEGVRIAGIVGDQQGALVGNKCLKAGEAKNTYGTGAFLLFCTGDDVVLSRNGLISTVAYQAGPDILPIVAVAGSAIQWLRDGVGLIQNAPQINTLASKVEDTGGVYFVTAFNGLLAPYWDASAGGILIGLTAYTTPSHIARATLEASAFQTRAILQAMAKDSGVELQHLKVDGGMTNGDLAMQLQADIGGFEVIRPEMRESTALGSALLAGSAIRLFGWDISKPETLSRVNTKGSTSFNPKTTREERVLRWLGWQRAVERSKGWNAEYVDYGDDD
ncbi:glycerol kinase [Rhizoctonia solani AG-1 IA]|uniref:glycerol kinase n=1 Tax=Thanatephorus cucumeris (strain AG1-IA) TaxID=983506 RepID=L8WNA2_THACA|nr:glycerol kinase [Rhizoctonia solani AG-1 IA]